MVFSRRKCGNFQGKSGIFRVEMRAFREKGGIFGEKMRDFGVKGGIFELNIHDSCAIKMVFLW